MYESAFDVGLQTRDGRFLSVSKASVAEMSADPPLPAHTNIPVEQAPDLMAYLTRLVTDSIRASHSERQQRWGRRERRGRR